MSAIDYTRVNFKDYPDTTTPITAQNLNKLDKGVYDLDVALTSTKDLLGTASQASGVSGATAFAKINQLNSDLNSKAGKTEVNGSLITTQIPLNCAGNQGAEDYQVQMSVPSNSTLLMIEQSVGTGNAIPHIKSYDILNDVLTVHYSVYRITTFADTQNVVTKALFKKTLA